MAQEIDLHRSADGFQQPGERSAMRGPVIGCSIGIAIFAAFLVWSDLTPIETAAVAPGVVVVESHRKSVQSLGGGIVKKLLVHDGDLVKAGQPLVELDDTQARAAMMLVDQQYRFYQAQLARLQAELDDAKEIQFPKDLIAAAETMPALRTVLDDERRQFATRRAALDGSKAVLAQQIVQLEQQVAKARSLQTAAEEQAAYIQDETGAVRILIDKGLETKPRLLALQRAAADLHGRAGEQASTISAARESMDSARLQIADLDNQRRKDVTTQIEQTQQLLLDASEKRTAAKDTLTQQEIVAPVTGKVTALAIFTEGGVVLPAKTMMEIVPDDDALMVDSRVGANDIDTVHAGLTAEVMLLRFTQRTRPLVQGTVTDVSADLLTDPKTGVGYYSARVRLDDKSVADMHDASLYPGMPVTTMILTGSSSILWYLVGPLIDMVHTARS